MFSQYKSAYSDPFTITPSDSTYLSKPTNGGIYVGGAGTMVVVLHDGTTVSFTCVAGTVIPVIAIRVNSTGTTATGLVGLA